LATSQIRLASVTVDPNRPSLWSAGSPAATPIRTRSCGVEPSVGRVAKPCPDLDRAVEGVRDVIEGAMIPWPMCLTSRP
jgi:hypothetical protein